MWATIIQIVIVIVINLLQLFILMKINTMNNKCMKIIGTMR
jgi:hypothetical protein